MKNKLLIIFVLMLCFSLLAGCTLNIKIPTDSSNIEVIESGNQFTITDSGNTIFKEEINTPEYTEVRVSTAKDIFQNIKPNTRIILTDDYYNLSEIDPLSFHSDYAYMEDEFDGYEFIIYDIDNLEICADSNVMPEIVTEAPHVNVISLENCNNVKLSGLVAGHAVEKGSCTGGVINIEKSSNIEISNCHLYGCGTYGIVANDSKNVHVTNSEIYECSYGLLDLMDSKNFVFDNCTFKDSQEYTMFALIGCQNIQFNNCNITGNTCDYSSSLISATDSSGITFTKCLFENNTYDYFCFMDDEVELISCKGKDSNFDERLYPDYSDWEY